MEFSLGKGELRADESHPLAAPFRHAMSTGKPPDPWTFLLTKDPSTQVSHVLGTFMHTSKPGDRVLFFPGGRFWLDDVGGWPARFVGKQVNHVTLDPPGKPRAHSSHIALYDLPKKESRGLGFTTKVRGGYLIPWFSLLVPKVSFFKPLPALLDVRFQSVRTDWDRFSQRLLAQGGTRAVAVPDPTLAQTSCSSTSGSRVTCPCRT